MRCALPTVSHPPPAAPAWLAGLWQRREILLPDGTADRGTRVFWGQTRSLYVDIRVPAGRPSGEGRASLADYAPGELRQLAEQKGFAGHVELSGTLCRWTRYIDYRPNNGRPDEGHLRVEGDWLYEEGDPGSVLGSAYRETYRRVAQHTRRSVALRCIAAAGGRDGVLVVLDDRFLWARSRRMDLPPAETLLDLIDKAGADRDLIHAYLDCEISYGRVEGPAAWIIELSTLPFRERQRLAGAARPGPDGAGIELESGAASDAWHIVESTMDRAALLALLNR